MPVLTDQPITPADKLVEAMARAEWLYEGKREDLWEKPRPYGWDAAMEAERKARFDKWRVLLPVIQSLSAHAEGAGA